MAIMGRIPTVPEYFKERIDSSVDLNSTPKICCPFHKEDTPSFSYSSEKGKWRCFGKCKIGGDVIDLHRAKFNLKTREEAKKSLYRLYNVTIETKLVESSIMVDADKVEREILIQKLLLKAKTVERWLELDYVMSKYPYELSDLQALLADWTGTVYTPVDYEEMEI